MGTGMRTCPQIRPDPWLNREVLGLRPCLSLSCVLGMISSNQPWRQTQITAEKSISILRSTCGHYARDKRTRTQQGRGEAWNRRRQPPGKGLLLARWWR